MIENKENIQQTRCDDDNSNNKAVIIVPTTIQTDESLVVMVHSISPNSTLHDILIHKAVETDIDDSKKEHTTSVSDFKEEHIFNDVDLSPRMKVVNTARKGKKQGNGESAQPSRVQPKRQTTSLKSSSQ